jgi:hypothetical protein
MQLPLAPKNYVAAWLSLIGAQVGVRALDAEFWVHS